MKTWPLHWRYDRGILERICPHGVGHPDPDDKASASDGIHGCDGCCAPRVTLSTKRLVAKIKFPFHPATPIKMPRSSFREKVNIILGVLWCKLWK
jgi:hypothetical protein